ncbi:MAG: transposase [Candidatus Bathyarchaeota archaeon]|nr:transposase [Candidatus Termitimicrobium sp.]
MFPYLTKHTYNRVARWQKITKTPSTHPLTPTEITRLTQNITEQHRLDLLKLRAKHLDKDELCALDSTTKTAYGTKLAEVRWGKNKENLPLPQTTEVVVYSLTSHLPVFYQSFPGNMPDAKSLETILEVLKHADFRALVYVTDRGYDSLHNLLEFIARGQAFVMCVKAGQRDVLGVIEGLGEFSGRPEGMVVDGKERIYHHQCDVGYRVVDSNTGVETTLGLVLNLYFDPIRRGTELLELDIVLCAQRAALEEHLKKRSVMGDEAAVRRDFRFYRVVCDPKTRVMVSFVLNEAKVAKAQRVSGFFAIMTNGVAFGAMETLELYKLRDEQEKCFSMMKDQMVADRQRVWSEEGKTGRLFVLFVSLVLGSYLRFIWKSTKLSELFSSSLEVLDEMRSIRCIEHPGWGKIITPFVGGQIDVCRAFGFEIPEGCSSSALPQKPKRKRGRPRKNANQGL